MGRDGRRATGRLRAGAGIALAALVAPPGRAQEIRVASPDPEVRFADGGVSLLASQIGYAVPGVRVAYLMAPTRAAGEAIAEFSLEDAAGVEVLRAAPSYAGEWLTRHFFRLDFSAITAPGSYRIRAGPLRSHRFPLVTPRELWLDPHWPDMAVRQLRTRIRHDAIGGFVDAGNDIRETNSHATMVVGLLDLLDGHAPWIGPAERAEIDAYVAHFTTFLRSQERPGGRIAQGYWLGNPITDGEWPNHLRGVWALLRLARHFAATDPVLAAALRAEAAAGLGWTRASQDLATAPTVLLTGRLLGEVEFHLQTGDGPALDQARAVAREIRLRQLAPGETTPGGLGGALREARGAATFARLNYHNPGAMTGEYSGLPLDGLVLLLEAYPDDAEAAAWRATIADFVRGWLAAAAARSPLGLVANGEYAGLRWFSDLFHGMSMTYALEAASLLRYARVVGEPGLVDLAERQLLWIGGLNTGSDYAGASEPFSCIVEKGYQWLHDGHGVLTGVTGSIVNGLSASPQFVPETPDPEPPIYLGDESWIAHTGAWLTASSELVRARLAVGPTLKAARSGGDVLLVWDDVAGATDYRVRSAGRPAGPFRDLVATARSGRPGVRLALAAGPFVGWRVSGSDGWRESPP